MTCSENVSLQKYADAANRQFNESETRLSEIESSFQTRMNGNTTGSLIGSILGTACWLAAFCYFFWYIRYYIGSTVSIICFCITLALILSMFADEIISFSYYGKISSYNNNIVQLKNRVNMGKSSISSNQASFMSSRTKGWHYPLSVGSSIPEEAASIESTINGMESLKGGFINGLKNFLFFTFCIALTAAGAWAAFGIAANIMTGFDNSIGGETIRTLCIIGLIITVIGEIILAKIVWSKTNCSVTNTTLLIAAAGPLMFLALILVASLVVKIVVWAVGVLLTILAVVFGGALLFGSMSGG